MTARAYRASASRAVLASLLLAGLAGAAAAQTPPAGAPQGTPQAAPRPALPAVTPQPASQLQAEFAVAAGDTVLFLYQSNELTLRSIKILDNQAAWLKNRADVKITIEAYCDDDIDPKQAAAFCLNRARAVRDYFVKQGIASERMSLVAFDDRQAPKPPPKKADSKKADGKKADGKKPGKDDKARRTNRRVSTRVSL
jgi:outer membrane protein OmpA-like peptidoglycan-associated protein